MRHGDRAAYVRQIDRLAEPLGDPDDLEPLVRRIGEARLVLLGEASHGTSDYYRWRAEISRRLILAGGITLIAVEGDWPDCQAVNRWLIDPGDPRGPREVLSGYARWPRWMWANEEVADFLAWLRARNDRRPHDARVRFHGLDVYSLWESMEAILAYLAEHEPDALDAARAAYRCFEPYGGDPQAYAWATRLVPTSCEAEVVALLGRLLDRAAPNGDDPDARLDVELNALVAADAERYYRAMVRGDAESWNVRDVHMADTLDRLLEHFGPSSRALVWAHNTHVGDARATDMASAGMVNLGQLARERHAADGVVLVGFGGFAGTVVAARSWGAPAERMVVPPARADTHEGLMAAAGLERALFRFSPDGTDGWPAANLGHRAIGVVYRPDGDSRGNWVPTRIGERYDVFCFLRHTSALRPLAPEPAPAGAELETAPWAV
jgi:erythromycin esterase-like protein